MEPTLNHLVDQQFARIRGTVGKYGWAVHALEQPPFTYTIGMFGHERHPELIVSGYCVHDAADLLCELAGYVRSGITLTPRLELSLQGWPGLRLVPLPVPAESSLKLLPYANLFYRGPHDPPVPALQLVWSDDNGNWPWDKEWTLPRTAQPLAVES